MLLRACRTKFVTTLSRQAASPGCVWAADAVVPPFVGRVSPLSRATSTVGVELLSSSVSH